MKIVNNYMKNFCSAMLAGVCLFLSLSVYATGEPTLEEFIKMPYEKKLEVCGQFVESSRVGHCAHFGEEEYASAYTQDEIVTAVKYCMEDKHLSSVDDLALCSRGIIDAGSSLASPSHSQDEYNKAFKFCSEYVSGSEQLGACAAIMLGKGKQHR